MRRGQINRLLEASVTIKRSRKLDAVALASRTVHIPRRASINARKVIDQSNMPLRRYQSTMNLTSAVPLPPFALKIVQTTQAAPKSVFPGQRLVPSTPTQVAKVTVPPAPTQVTQVAVPLAPTANAVSLISAAQTATNADDSGDDSAEVTPDENEASLPSTSAFPGHRLVPGRKTFFNKNQMDKYVTKLQPTQGLFFYYNSFYQII